MYLSLLNDFDEAGKYAWGAAALAFLYRELHKAALYVRSQGQINTKAARGSYAKSSNTIGGCLTLLQVTYLILSFLFFVIISLL